MTLAEMERLFDNWWDLEGRWSFGDLFEADSRKPTIRFGFIAALRSTHGVALPPAV